MQNDLEMHEKVGKLEEKAATQRQMASAWASIGDLYMTHLCDELNAQ